jgi:hypothetical protein
MITEQEKNELLSLKHEDISMDLIKDFFCATKNRPKKRFECNDKLELKANEYYNKSPIVTTVGRFVINKTILEPKLIKYLGYQNVVLTKKNIQKLSNSIIKLSLDNEEVTIKDVTYFMDMINWIGYGTAEYICPSLNIEAEMPTKAAMKRKQELLNEYKEEIQNNDVATINNIENELIDISKEEMKDMPSLNLYDSGLGDFKNHYKNSALMRGAIMDFANDGEFTSSMASLVDGIPKDEYYKFANIATAGAYARVA